MSTRRLKIYLSCCFYDLSISDLMSALCCIFLLFLAVTVYKLNQQKTEYEKKNELATKYKNKQEELYRALKEEFSADLERWTADIANVDGAIRIRFTDDAFMFAGNAPDLTPKFESVLQNFFPRLIKIVGQDYFSHDILELRIEGHTKKTTGSKYDYEAGMSLSMDRTRNVLTYCLENPPPYEKIAGEDAMNWIRQRIAGIGYSFSIPGENFKDRRVEFKIRTKAEAIIDELQKLDGVRK